MRIHVVDAFTDRPFAGNPAAVCVLAEPAAAGWMQRIAMEMNLSETAFPRPLEADPDADYELRWFPPKVEVARCGHATLGSAHVLYETGAVPADRPIRFRTLHSGVLTVRREGGLLAMDFPACPPERAEAPEGPVTGSAHCMLAPFWAERLGRTDLRAHQASPRGGDVHVTVRGDRVILRGTAVTVLDGTLRVEPSCPANAPPDMPESSRSSVIRVSKNET